MLKPTTRDEMDRHLKTAFDKWLTRPIASITSADCGNRYEEIATKGLRKKPALGSSASSFSIIRSLGQALSRLLGEHRKRDYERSPLFRRQQEAVRPRVFD